MQARVKRLMLVLSVLVIALAACSGGARSGEVVVTERRSPNYTVFVIEDDEGVRRLRFERDGVDQSAVVLGDPDQLVFSYTKGLVAALAARPDPARVLVVGLGGGTFPMFLRKHLPTAHIDVAEIDPVVIDVAKKHLGFREDPEMVVHLGDGRAYIENASGTWDLIVLDAYGAEEIPLSLSTRAFYAATKQRLAPGGLVAANVWSDNANPRYRAMLRTFEAVFPEVHVVAPQRSESRIVLAFGAPTKLTKEDLLARAATIKRDWKLRFDLPLMIKRGHAGPGELPPGGVVLED